MSFLDELAARRRFGMRSGLETIRKLCAALDDPQQKFKAIHVAGTNGKGAVCAILDAALRNVRMDECSNVRMRIGRCTSPHLVKINERFFLDGAPIDDEALERVAERVSSNIQTFEHSDITFFEALTAVAFELYAEAKVDYAILECGLGGRLDATNVCDPALSVITRIGLDHCDWLGDTLEKIATEKAGIVKIGVPIVLGRNEPEVVDVVRRRAEEVGAPFRYAPDLADESEIPSDFSLPGSFNRENAVTALAALRVFAACGEGGEMRWRWTVELPASVVWPGRFQRVGDFIVDGAHNPPAARALVAALSAFNLQPLTFNLIFGACGDKDVGEVLSILAPIVKKGCAVRTNNPRSLSAEETAAKMRAAGIDAIACASLKEAIELTRGTRHEAQGTTLICGSLFLAGEALVELGAYPWGAPRFDKAELLRPDPCVLPQDRV